MLGKMAKGVGTAIRKSIVVLFLPCLLTFLGFHPSTENVPDGAMVIIHSCDIELKLSFRCLELVHWF